MTLLEYVLARLAGPPRKINGTFYWLCPFHGDTNPSLTTLPHRAGYKDRFRCHACGAWGDEFDILRLYFPNEKYPQHRDRLDDFRLLYERSNQMPIAETAIPYLSPGMTRDERDRILDEEFSPAADTAIERILAFLDEPANPQLANDRLADANSLRVIEYALRACHDAGLHPLALAGRCAGESWFRTVEQEHLDECDDPECDTIMCRAERGLPPLTKAELKADREAREQKRREIRARIKKSINLRRAVKG